jgi:Tol biopolymer transport system component
MAWYSRDGKLLGVIGASGFVLDPAISPDGKSVVFRRLSSSRSDLWLWDVTKRNEQRLTTHPSTNLVPSWSPAGDRIAFSSRRAGAAFDLYQRLVNRSGQDELLLPSGTVKFVSQWSRDGKYIVYSENDPKTGFDVWVLPMASATERKPVPFLRSEFNEYEGQLSPDSHWIAYTSDESGEPEVYMRSFPTGDLEKKISLAGGEQPRWRGNGKELFFVGADGKMMVVEVKALAGAKPTFDASAPQPLFEAHLVRPPTNPLFEYDVTADGKRFLVNTTGASTSAPFMNVVLNWDAGLKK